MKPSGPPGGDDDASGEPEGSPLASFLEGAHVRYAATMRAPWLSSLLVLTVLAAAAPAQGAKPKKAQKQQSKQPAAEPRPGPEKDDAATKKDKAIAALDAFLSKHAPNTKQDGWRTTMSEPPQQRFAEDCDYFWHLATSKGELKVKLMPQIAPMHCTSAVYLTRAGFYDGLAFHRAIKGFMAQGGCPNGTGVGNAGYMMKGETSEAVKHDKKGLISAANEDGKEKTDGSQFFLTFAPCPHLDGKHTIFGEVVEGLDVVDAIDAVSGEGESQKPTETLTIVRAWVVVVPNDGGSAEGDMDDATDKGSKPKKGEKTGKPKKPSDEPKKQQG